jgi:hypothetical protein
LPVDDRTTLNRLFQMLRDAIAGHHSRRVGVTPKRPRLPTGRCPPFAGRHRQGAAAAWATQPTHRLADGIRSSLPWYFAITAWLAAPANAT